MKSIIMFLCAWVGFGLLAAADLVPQAIADMAIYPGLGPEVRKIVMAQELPVHEVDSITVAEARESEQISVTVTLQLDRDRHWLIECSRIIANWACHSSSFGFE